MSNFVFLDDIYLIMPNPCSRSLGLEMKGCWQSRLAKSKVMVQDSQSLAARESPKEGIQGAGSRCEVPKSGKVSFKTILRKWKGFLERTIVQARN